MLQYSGIYTDLYELTMCQGYVLSGRSDESATFDYFFRKNPFEGGFVVFAGIGDLLSHLESLSFSEREIDYLRDQGFKDSFLSYLADFRFSGTIHAPEEGTLVFPSEPVVRVEGNLPEVQLVETILLNILNFQSLIATKAARMRMAAGPDRKLIDFGLRRSHSYGSLHAARGAIVGGFESTSHVLAGMLYDIPVTGTMAHSWIQSYDDELEAFRTFANHFPENTILLVDTYDTLESGIPNAITVGKEMEKRGEQLLGVRLDSGDLTELSKEARKMLDEAGLDYVKIAASNQLDEYRIAEMLEAGAEIDAFGVGTRLVTAKEDPALDGVYKLAENAGKPRLKLSESKSKITLPGSKRAFRGFDDNGMMVGDIVTRSDEEVNTGQQIFSIHDDSSQTLSATRFEELHQVVMKDGELTVDLPDPQASAERTRRHMGNLPAEYKQFSNPDSYPVGLSEALHTLREDLIQKNSI